MSQQTDKKRSSMAQRCVTGAVLIAALSVVLAVGGWLLALTAFVCLSIALYEELHALTLGGHRPVWWTSYAALAISMPLMMRYSSEAPMPLLMLLSFCVLAQVIRRENPDLVDVMVSILPMLTLVLPGMCLFGILDTEPRTLRLMLLVFVFTTAVGGDTFAYFVGSAIGGPKLCPHISPRKTVAGAIGGLLGSLICTVLAGEIFRWCVPGFAFPPAWANALAGLVGGVAAQVGDLFASMVKRHCRVKDFGHIFPGHGGMLDRLDSIVFTAILIYCYRVILLGLA